MTKTVRLDSLIEDLKKEMPGVFMRQDYSRMQTTLGINIWINADYSILPIGPDIYGTGEDYSRITEYLRMLTEQLRLRGIRELGLQPRLTAQEKEVSQYREASLTLGKQLDEARAKIGELQLQIDTLLGEIDE